MQTPGSAKAEAPLRGDYAGAAADYTVPQRWDEYSPAMHDRWRRLYARQSRLAGRYAAPQFNAGLARLDCAAAIPRFDEANRILADATGWKLVAVPGFIPDDCFFDHLAARRFPVTRWLRDEHELDYLVEPDVFHDFFGHVPMLLDRAIADFLVLYGQAGRRALAAGALDMLARIYWYTIEFGLVGSGDGVRAFGAGILSSAGETVFSIDDPDVPRLRFDPVRIMRTAYRIDSFQRCYFVLDSLEQLMEELIALDFGPVYARWRDSPPIPPGEVLPTDRRWEPGRR
jgi:phenylalanine-4-hydroxylase